MITRWFYLPSLQFLLLALLTGTWLRLQWGWPQWQILGLQMPKALFFRADYLLHGHSHVALLGWTFLALAGLVLEAGTRRTRLPVRSLRVLAALIILVTLVLFIAFVMDGYAPLSIALSTIHMLLGYGIAWIFFRHARTDGNTGSRYFFEGAVFWMVMATAGPWLLATGRGLSPFWMDAAVQYYLHVLFNGWLLFGLAGLAFRYLIHPRFRQKTWPFWLMMAGLVPSLLPRLGSGAPDAFGLPAHSITAAAMAGSVLFAAGGLTVVWFIYVSIRVNKISRGMRTNRQIGKSLLWVGLFGSVPVLLLPVFMSWPPVHALWSQSDFLTMGFIHLHLLLVVSTLLLYTTIQRVVFATGTGPPTSCPARGVGGFQLLLRLGILLFASGSLAMVGLLIATGLFQLAGSLPPYPVQKTLFFSGIMTYSGAVLVVFLLFLCYFKPCLK